MRCYHLCNMYLSSIQQGIQSAHSQMELFVKYSENIIPGYETIQKQNLYTWAKNHKTMIVLNGGYLSHMNEALEFFSKETHHYPYAPFYEGSDALGGILTNIAIVLSEKIYGASELIRAGKLSPDFIINANLSVEEFTDIEVRLKDYGLYSSFEVELCNFMNKFRLAN